MNRKYESKIRSWNPGPGLLAFCLGVSMLPLAWAVEPLPMDRHDLPDGRVLYALKGAGVNVSEAGGITIVPLPGAGSGSGSASGRNTSGATTTAGKSPGDCGVCEYWDEHEKDCLPLPAGTAVPGQPCKECDGAGGVRNKPDGTLCDYWSGIIMGCCYSGVCELSGRCYEFEERGTDTNPSGCPQCKSVLKIPTCDAKVKESKYNAAFKACTGSQNYKSELIDLETYTICEINWDNKELIYQIIAAAKCLIDCGTILTTWDAEQAIDCWECITGAGFDPCDFVEKCEETADVRIITGLTAKPDGGSCP